MEYKIRFDSDDKKCLFILYMSEAIIQILYTYGIKAFEWLVYIAYFLELLSFS